MKISTQPSRGRKQCPNCSLYVGVRLAQCSCGHMFDAKAPAKMADSQGESVSHPIRSFFHEVLTPAGQCPVPLKTTASEGVKAWAYDVLRTNLECGRILSTSALAYYVREFFPLDSSEYCGIMKVLKE